MRNATYRRCALAAALLVAFLVFPAVPAYCEESGQTRVGVSGKQITLNGKAVTLYGLRVGSAVLRDDWTDQVISQLDIWKSYGVNSLAVWLQGTSGGYIHLFAEDGKDVIREKEPIKVSVGAGDVDILTDNGFTTGPEVIARTQRLVEEADKRGMVVIIGVVYYPSVAPTDTRESMVNAMKTIAAPFKDYTNVIFNVWNQPNGRDLEANEDLIAYVKAIKEVAPNRLVGAGGRNSDDNLILGSDDTVDLVLTDAGRTYKEVVAAFEESVACGKPVVNVQSFGSRANAYIDDTSKSAKAPEGYYIDFDNFRRVYGAWEDKDYKDAAGKKSAGKNAYCDLITYVSKDTGKQIHTIIAASGWFQGSSRVGLPEQLGSGNPGVWDNTYVLGYGKANGTPQNPGIKWILEKIKECSKN